MTLARSILWKRVLRVRRATVRSEAFHQGRCAALGVETNMRPRSSVFLGSGRWV